MSDEEEFFCPDCTAWVEEGHHDEVHAEDDDDEEEIDAEAVAAELEGTEQ